MMSSTNRGRARSSDDFYATPHWVVHRLLEKIVLPGGNWLEPGAGEGNIIRAVNRPDVNWTALELRKECRPHLQRIEPCPEIIITDKFVAKVEDRRKPLYGRKFDVALGNPPFSLALEFVQESLDLADTVVMLLRLNFLASSTRAEFMRSWIPDVYVLPNRPSFTGKGTDSIESA
jgi:16S rRNA A1518/A1519 N6-dimethyltransferase RsmA/KsgA/DIM1 with predicted DNA glycosylase/AP lyase activity